MVQTFIRYKVDIDLPGYVSMSMICVLCVYVVYAQYVCVCVCMTESLLTYTYITHHARKHTHTYAYAPSCISWYRRMRRVYLLPPLWGMGGYCLGY